MNGFLLAGRRLLSSKMKRFADRNLRDLHDELLSDGRCRIVMFGSRDLADPEVAPRKP